MVDVQAPITMFAYKYLKKNMLAEPSSYISVPLGLLSLSAIFSPLLFVWQKFPMSWVGIHIQLLVKTPAVQGELRKSSGTPKNRLSI